MKMIRNHYELEVYRIAVDLAMEMFELSKHFPKAETYSLTDQLRRSSRSAAAIAEGWRRRKYEAAFVNKLNESESEAAETQSWLEFAVKCGYVERGAALELHHRYDQLIGKLVNMGNNSAPWVLKKSMVAMKARKVTPAYLPARLPA
jgi:four helix bundle protein